MENDYNLLVAFPDGSPSFVHGFEAGVLWQRMQTGEQQIDGVFHSSNLELFYRLAKAASYNVMTQDTDFAEWTEVSFTPKATEEKPSFKLRLIEGGLGHKGSDQ